MAEGQYMSSQGGMDRVPGGGAPDSYPTGNGDCRDGNTIQEPTAVDGLRQRNAAAGRAFAWPGTEDKACMQDLDGYANDARKTS